MKPYIVYITAEGESVTISKAKLEQIIQEAYERGKADASPCILQYPTGTWTTQYPNYSTESTHITCGTQRSGITTGTISASKIAFEGGIDSSKLNEANKTTTYI